MSRQTDALIRKALAQLRDAGPVERLKILDGLRPHLKEMDFRKVSDHVSAENAEDSRDLVQARAKDRAETDAVARKLEEKKAEERKETQFALLMAAIFTPPTASEKSSIDFDPEAGINEGPRPRWAM
jgi:Spy/CpxP family protein refolding chaperone